MTDAWLQALGGAGMFLFSLRYLTRQFERAVSWRTRHTLDALLQTPWRCLAAGCLATLVVQASSITILTGMGLLGASVISLEQGFYLVLGAALGTTAKAWYVGLDVMRLGPAVVGVTSLALVVIRKANLRVILGNLMAIGFALWGLHLLTLALLSLLGSRGAAELLEADGRGAQAVGILAGFVATAAIQSSSAVVAMVIALAQQEAVTFPYAATLILGANLGTTLVPLFASLEYPTSVRRLALAYGLEKGLGVLLAWLLLPILLRTVDLVVPGPAEGAQLAWHLAGVHTLFNLMTLILWGLFPGLVLRPACALVAGPAKELPDPVSAVVRRLLQRSPARACAEAQKQVQKLNLRLKELLEEVVNDLQQAGPSVSKSQLAEQRAFRSHREGVLELCLAGLRSQDTAADAQALLKRLVALDLVFRQAAELRRRTDQASDIGRFWEGAALKEILGGQLGPLLDDLWLWASTSEPTELGRVNNFLNKLHDAIWQSLAATGLGTAQRDWLFELHQAVRGLLLCMKDSVEERPL